MTIDPSHRAVPQIFARSRTAARIKSRRFKPTAFLRMLAIDQLAQRLDDVTRDFDDVLIVGPPVDPRSFDKLGGSAIETIPDPFADAPRRASKYQLIVWPQGMESLSDVPGALARLRGLLKPDGLLLGTCIGGGSFPLLRSIMRAADGPAPQARMHPQIDVHAMGELLQRAGFALPVADSDRFALRYRSLGRLVADLREAGLTNALSEAAPPISKAGLDRARAAFEAARDEQGKARESVILVQFSGWAPAPTQPRPARRGSATHSLASALRDQSPRESTDDI